MTRRFSSDLEAALKADDSWDSMRLCGLVEQYETAVVHQVAKKPWGLPCLRVLAVRFPGFLLGDNVRKNTAVHYAACYQDSDSMQFFKDQLGPRCFRHRNELGETATHCAARNTRSNSAFKWLVGELGPDCLRDKDKNENSTPVHRAALYQDSDSMQFIKDQLGSRCFRHRNKFGLTAIHFAAMNTESNSALKWLVGELGPDCLRKKDQLGNTAAHCAAEYQDEDTLRLIVESIGDSALDMQNDVGETVLDWVKKNRRSDSMLALAERLREERRLAEAAKPLSVRGAEGAASTEPSLDPNFKSWDFILQDGKKQPIGAGAFGTVYKALTDQHQTVAVKTVKLQFGIGDDELEKAVERVSRGIEVLRDISHPSIVRFLRWERSDRWFCIFTELLDGLSLAELIWRQRRPFGEDEARQFSGQILSVLNFLHSLQSPVLHRDIKCSNIMLTHEAVIKLIDFGLAKEIVATTDFPHHCGTTYFMAPELLISESATNFSAQTDVWAFGCTVFEMLAGKPPNFHLAWQEMADFLKRKEMPPLPDGVSKGMRDFYGRCVVKDATERADTKELLEHRWLKE